MYQITWTPHALETYEHILDFILERWSIQVVMDLNDKVLALEQRLSNNQSLCPASKKQKGLRRCVVTRHTSMLYRTNDKEIQIIAFFDSRTNHSF